MIFHEKKRLFMKKPTLTSDSKLQNVYDKFPFVAKIKEGFWFFYRGNLKLDDRHLPKKKPCFYGTPLPRTPKPGPLSFPWPLFFSPLWFGFPSSLCGLCFVCVFLLLLCSVSLLLFLASNFLPLPHFLSSFIVMVVFPFCCGSRVPVWGVPV